MPKRSWGFLVVHFWGCLAESLLESWNHLRNHKLALQHKIRQQASASSNDAWPGSASTKAHDQDYINAAANRLHQQGDMNSDSATCTTSKRSSASTQPCFLTKKKAQRTHAERELQHSNQPDDMLDDDESSASSMSTMSTLSW